MPSHRDISISTSGDVLMKIGGLKWNIYFLLIFITSFIFYKHLNTELYLNLVMKPVYIYIYILLRLLEQTSLRTPQDFRKTPVLDYSRPCHFPYFLVTLGYISWFPSTWPSFWFLVLAFSFSFNTFLNDFPKGSDNVNKCHSTYWHYRVSHS